MAFGTGTHESTRMCLRALESLADLFEGSQGASLLDVGTGSGILAIAAVFLGIKKAIGIDFDHQAIACAKKNAENNGVTGRVTLSTDSLKKTAGQFSIVVANILPHVLIDMKEDLSAHVSQGGFLVLSGILNEKAGQVADVFSESLTLHREIHENEWTCLVFKKQ